MDFQPFQEFGLVGIMAGVISILLFIIIKWTLETTKDILAQGARERECWVKAFNEHTEQAKIFHESVKSAHEYQRMEHEKFSEQQDKSTACLVQIEVALGRINGYKH